LLLLSLLAVALSGCSTFDGEWRRAATAPASDPFSGQWEGRWTSGKHKGAGGRLRAVVTPADSRSYRTHFKADWLAFSSAYVVTLQAQRRGERLHFQGEHDLGKLFGGIYRYEGEATPLAFRSSYNSSYDHGTFAMSRRLTKTAPIP
jgi:hypothetical protein